jgi:hypothetical protein
MGNKYVPSVKDQKAQQRFHQNQKKKMPAVAKKPSDPVNRRAK